MYCCAGTVQSKNRTRTGLGVPGLVPYPSPTVPYPSPTVLSLALLSCPILCRVLGPLQHSRSNAPGADFSKAALRAPGGEFHPRMGGAQTARFRMYISEGALRCARSDRERT